jgi:hypothetical protein
VLFIPDCIDSTLIVVPTSLFPWPSSIFADILAARAGSLKKREGLNARLGLTRARLLVFDVWYCAWVPVRRVTVDRI